jgi:urocanate hydratase
VQGTFETFLAAAKKHFGEGLEGRLVVSAGLGGMGGAQPLAATMCGAAALIAEVEPERIERRLKSRYLDVREDSLDRAIDRAIDARDKKVPLSIGVQATAVDLLDRLLARGVLPDLLTDQTSAHDELNGYVPAAKPGERLEDLFGLRRRDPARYIDRAYATMSRHMRALLEFQRRGAVVFDYGNNIRGQAKKAGVADAFEVGGFVPLFMRELFCEGKGPFRWAALSGNPEDIRATDRALLDLFPGNRDLARWLRLAEEKVAFQGLPARICWLGYGERSQAGLMFNDMVRSGSFGRRSSSAGTIWTPDRWRRPTARRRGCATA